ncbi:MAG: hypothetical protein KKA79_04195 [Nanoarchaeota archaeon]|nr:hypothetical protein [Nanoarchaeota archaeon]MCG2718140.1 hypothetical protein [Nanoarchaeota archaeon]
MFKSKNKSLEEIGISSEDFYLLADKGTIEDILHPDAEFKVEDITLSINIPYYDDPTKEEISGYVMSEVPALKISGSRPKFWKGVKEFEGIVFTKGFIVADLDENIQYKTEKINKLSKYLNFKQDKNN